MGSEKCLCIYDDQIHEKEMTSEFKDIRNAKICYFTFPAIITTNKNNKYIYGNVPKRYETKIWVNLNDEVFDNIYGLNQQDNNEDE